MPIVTWLLSRLRADPSGCIEVNRLFNAFDFEMKESGTEVNISKRLFLEHILKVYPGARRERKTGNKNTKVTSYHGISLLPIDFEKTVEPMNLQAIKGFVPSEIKVIEEKTTSVKCKMEMACSRNGNQLVKFITFHDTGEWELEISGKVINLEKVYISNSYSCNKTSINIVLNAVKTIALCAGIEVTRNVIMSRFHLLETCLGDVQGKRLRSLLCNMVVTMNSETGTCDKCRRMTMNTSSTDKNPTTSQSNPPTKTTKDDILKLIPGATEEMVELILSQAQNANRDPKGRRWTQGMISVCLQWYCRSPQSYESFRASKYLILPSRSTLIQYKTRVKQVVGFDNNIFAWMFDEADRKDIAKEGYYGGLIIDEMAIQSDIQICKNGDIIELTGFMNVGEEGNLNHIMRKGKNEKVLGTHALQLVFLGVTGFRFPVAHFISDGVQAPEIFSLFWEAVDRMRQFGFYVLYTCMDGAQSNRSFMHLNVGKNTTTFTAQSPCTYGNMIFMMDSKHVIKKIRNNIIKSGNSKSSTRLLTLQNSDTIQWKMFIDCYEWDKNNALQLHRKLTNEHIYPSNQLKMRNHLAEDVLDSEMLNLMIQYQQSLGDTGSELNGAIELLKKTSKLVQIFSDMRPVKTCEDPRLQELLSIAEWFDSWKKDSLENDSILSKNRSKLIMSLQCHEDIQSCIVAFVALCGAFLKKSSEVYITPGLINSDVVENTFNQQRSTYHGANSNPNALQYRRALNSIVIGQNMVSQKANAGKNRVAALPYKCSLKKSAHPIKRKLTASGYSNIKVIRI